MAKNEVRYAVVDAKGELMVDLATTYAQAAKNAENFLQDLIDVGDTEIDPVFITQTVARFEAHTNPEIEEIKYGTPK